MPKSVIKSVIKIGLLSIPDDKESVGFSVINKRLSFKGSLLFLKFISFS